MLHTLSFFWGKEELKIVLEKWIINGIFAVTKTQMI